MEEYIYNRYAVYLKEHYGQKVYKLPVHIAVNCPNRKYNSYGCTYCGEKGAGKTGIQKGGGGGGVGGVGGGDGG